MLKFDPDTHYAARFEVRICTTHQGNPEGTMLVDVSGNGGLTKFLAEHLGDIIYSALPPRVWVELHAVEIRRARQADSEAF